MRSNGSENVKTPKCKFVIGAKGFQTCPDFFSQRSSQNHIWGNFEFLFLNDYLKKIQIHHLYHIWGNRKPQLFRKREIVERNGVKFGAQLILVEQIWGTLDLVAFKVIWGHLHLGFSGNTIFERLLLLQSWVIFNPKIYRCSLWQSTHLEIWQFIFWKQNNNFF